MNEQLIPVLISMAAVVISLCSVRYTRRATLAAERALMRKNPTMEIGKSENYRIFDANSDPSRPPTPRAIESMHETYITIRNHEAVAVDLIELKTRWGLKILPMDAIMGNTSTGWGVIREPKLGDLRRTAELGYQLQASKSQKISVLSNRPLKKKDLSLVWEWADGRKN